MTVINLGSLGARGLALRGTGNYSQLGFSVSAAGGSFRFFAGKGDDFLEGGANNDFLLGILGADTLTGRGGADVFRFDSTAHSNTAKMDQILDFTPGTDKLDLTRIDANTLVAGDQAFSWIGSNAFTGSAGQLRACEQNGS